MKRIVVCHFWEAALIAGRQDEELGELAGVRGSARGRKGRTRERVRPPARPARRCPQRGVGVRGAQCPGPRLSLCGWRLGPLVGR